MCTYVVVCVSCFVVEGVISSITSPEATCAARVVALAGEPLLTVAAVTTVTAEQVVSLRGWLRLVFPQLPTTTARMVRARPPRVIARVLGRVPENTFKMASLPQNGSTTREYNTEGD